MKKSKPKLSSCKYYLPLLITLFGFFTQQIYAQGTWTPLTHACPVASGGGMLLLSDGTVLAKTFSGGTDGYGNLYYKLTPDTLGSYINGTWSAIAPMHNTRLYYSSQVLKDGRVYVAGGEYGSGSGLGETYDPLTNVWTNAPNPGKTISDANSEILPDGRVLQALVTGNLTGTDIYDPIANTYTTGPTAKGIHNESAWVKLRDSSILFVNRETTSSERYIPSSNTWITDATLPVSLYDPYGDETGAGFLLPNGKAFFLGATGLTAIYTPSGNTSPGSWIAGPNIPNSQGTPDAAAAMMVTGNILCAVSPTPTSGNHFPSPTSYYEYNYITNAFTRQNAPAGGLTTNSSSYITNMLDLPDGRVLFALQNSTQFYVYTPSGSPVAAGKPAIKKIVHKLDSAYTLIGVRFNGISEGAAYGDDWQMASNYPIVRITSSDSRVYYARTSNWNRTEVSTGTLPDTAQFIVPSTLPTGTYSLVVIVNGISSSPAAVFKYHKAGGAPQTYPSSMFTKSTSSDMKGSLSLGTALNVYPNPSRDQTTVHFSLEKVSHVYLMVTDMYGKEVARLMDNVSQEGDHSVLLNTSRLLPGTYLVSLMSEKGTETVKLIVQ